MAIDVKAMDPEVRKAKRFRIILEVRPRTVRPMIFRVPCEYCGMWTECTENTDMAVCELCRSSLSSLD